MHWFSLLGRSGTCLRLNEARRPRVRHPWFKEILPPSFCLGYPVKRDLGMKLCVCVWETEREKDLFLLISINLKKIPEWVFELMIYFIENGLTFLYAVPFCGSLYPNLIHSKDWHILLLKKLSLTVIKPIPPICYNIISQPNRTIVILWTRESPNSNKLYLCDEF